MADTLREALLQLRFDSDVKDLVDKVTPYIQTHFEFERVTFIDCAHKQFETAVAGDLPPGLRDEILLNDQLKNGEALLTSVEGIVYGCIPIRSKNRLVGLLLVDKGAKAISLKEMEQISIVGDYLGLILTSTHHIQRRSYVHQLLTQLATSMDLESLLELLTKELKRLLHFDGCEIILNDQELGLVRAHTNLDMAPQRCPIALKVFHQQSPERIEANCNCPMEMKSGVCIPIKHFNGPLGVMCLANRESDFPDHHVEAVIETMGHAAIAIYNAKQQRINDDLEQLKTDFLTTVSHELRTPLTSIKGFVETLAKPDLMLPPEQQKSIYNILTKQTERLSSLVEELLDMAQLEIGKCEMAPREIRVDNLINETLKLMSGILAPFEIESDLIPITLTIDAERIAQALINLLENAAKYSPPGSKIRVQLQEENGGALIKVMDQGIGIAPEDRQKLFQKFQRLNNSLTRADGGTGVGLYLSAKILAAHGGRLWVENPSWKKGACFVMFLPFSPLNNQQGRV